MAKKQYQLVSCTINGREVEQMVDVRASLTDMLRNDYHLTSVKKGCEVGECGACNVLVLCIILITDYGESAILSIAAFLISVSLSSMSQCFIGSRISAAVQFVYIVLCFYNPVFCCMLPLMFYDIMSERKIFFEILTGTVLLFNIKRFGYVQIVLIFAIIAVSFLLEKRTSELETAQNKLIETRDQSEEVNILLTEKNRYLCERRDHEIRIAVLTERNRIAREIHDNVGHMLSRTLLQMGALLVTNKDDKLRPELEKVKDTLNEAMTSIRESVHNLHDDSVDLKNTVIELTKPLKDSFKVKLDMDFSEDIPKNIKFCFIGVIKEGISNIIKYSNGDSVIITIREQPAFYQLVIEDNGTNNNGIIYSDGIGLENMKIRTESLGGIFKYYSEKNKFKIFISIQKQGRML